MEKVELPIKTKIAAWWMKILGIATVVFILVLGAHIYLKTVPYGHYEDFRLIVIFLGIIFLGSLIIFCLGNGILKRKRSSWGISILFLIGIIFLMGGSSLFFYHQKL